MESKQNFSDQQLLKPSDVARILNISRSLSYRLLENGDIPTVRINTAVRVKSVDLFNYIEQSIHKSLSKDS